MITLKSSAQRVQKALEEFGLTFKVIEFAESTRTAKEAADAIGCQIGQIAKTLIFKGKQSHKAIIVIASGSNRVDEKKVTLLVGEQIERADADFVREKTGYAIGGVAPVGFIFEIQPFIDRDLLIYQEIWAAAGTPHSVFSLIPHDLIRVTGGRVEEVKKTDML